MFIMGEMAKSFLITIECKQCGSKIEVEPSLFSIRPGDRITLGEQDEYVEITCLKCGNSKRVYDIGLSLPMVEMQSFS